MECQRDQQETNNTRRLSFDEATDEDDDFHDATTSNKSMLIKEEKETLQSRVDSLKEVIIKRIKDIELKQNFFQDIRLTPSPENTMNMSTTVSQQQKGECFNQDENHDSPSSISAISSDTSSDGPVTSSQNPCDKDEELKEIDLGQVPVSNDDMVDTVVNLMKKREGALTFGKVDKVYSFRMVRCLFRVGSTQDEGTMEVCKLCRFETAIASEDIAKATIIDSNKRELSFCCSQNLIDELEYYQFCFKNKSGEVIHASLPFKIMLDEFGTRSILDDGQEMKLGCITQEDEAILQGSNNANPDEDDEGDFVVVRSKKILLEEKIRELSAYINVVEHDRTCKRNLIENLQSELKRLKEECETLEFAHKDCHEKLRALQESLTNARLESMGQENRYKLQVVVLKREIQSLTDQIDGSKKTLKTSQQEYTADKAAREAYINSLKLTVTDLERQLQSKNKLLAEATKSIEQEKLLSDNRAAELRRQIECIKELNNKLELSYKNQKNYLTLTDHLVAVQAKNTDLMKEKSQLDEVLSRKCKSFAEQEDCIKQLKARLSQAAEEYEQLFRRNYKLEKKYNRLQTKMTSLSFGADDMSDSGSNKPTTAPEQSRSILTEVTQGITKKNNKDALNNWHDDMCNLYEHLIEKQKQDSGDRSILFAQSQPVAQTSPKTVHPQVRGPHLPRDEFIGISSEECKEMKKKVLSELLEKSKKNPIVIKCPQSGFGDAESFEDNQSEKDKVLYSSVETEIIIPCSYCDEGVVCTTTNLNPILTHLDQQHKARVCPICALPFDVKQPEAEKFYHTHVMNHLDKGSWPVTGDKAKKKSSGNNSPTERGSSSLSNDQSSNMPGVFGIAGMGRRVFMSSNQTRNPLEEFFNKFKKQD